MSLSIQVLGSAGRDNALLVTVDTGQAVSKLLFDCGDGCLWQLPFGTVQEIDHLCFSHLHMDHVGGFDTFFRCTFNRIVKENHVWGPPQTAQILQHRFQGFVWNLVGEQQATWRVHDLYANRVETHRVELAEAFARDHAEGQQPHTVPFLQGPGYAVEGLLMDHGTPSVAYIIREQSRVNIDAAKLAQLGLRPGPWLQKVRGPHASDRESVVVEGVERPLRPLQELLLTETKGDAVAYLTDFLLDEAAVDRLAPVLHGVGTVVCESQYRHADAELARRNYHMTTTQVAGLAKRSGVGQLVLFHLSDRYRPDEWQEMLTEAQTVFSPTAYPEHWGLV
jgi:ribonuclease Z